MEYRSARMLIGGTWTDGTGTPFPVMNPATEEQIGTVPAATDAEIRAGLEAAERGFAVWRHMPPDRRGDILIATGALLRGRAEGIARMLTREQGKPLAEARTEILRAADLLDWDAGEGRRAYGRILPGPAGVRQSVLRQPIGVVAAFSPWNLPVSSAVRKIGGALAAGCAVILKPSEETPASVAALVACFQDAGLPDGVITLLFGDPPQISQALIADPLVRAITFTGSVPVGKALAALAGQHMKPAVMELGGHAPVIVCEDADAEAAAKACAAAKFRNAGQICIAPTRFLVHDSLHDHFAQVFADTARAIRVGNGLEDGVQMGPLANARRLAAIEALVADARDHGAQVVAGGARIGNKGHFHAPTVLTDVPLGAAMMNDEPFGPVAPIRRTGSLPEALAEANRLPFGLAAYAFTDRASTAETLIEGLECGILTINHITGVPPEGPFGGVKDSGYGREGGTESLGNFLTTKYVSHRYTRG